jgi:transcription antitermination factor NusA-like protein
MKGNLVSRLKNAFEKKKVDLVLYDLKAFFFF